MAQIGASLFRCVRLLICALSWPTFGVWPLLNRWSLSRSLINHWFSIVLWGDSIVQHLQSAHFEFENINSISWIRWLISKTNDFLRPFLGTVFLVFQFAHRAYDVTSRTSIYAMTDDDGPSECSVFRVREINWAIPDEGRASRLTHCYCCSNASGCSSLNTIVAWR